MTLIKIKQGGLTPLVPAPRQELQVGQWAIALGRTYDVSFPNLSVGILSALNRIWGKAVQTDAKISPANYGGPLIDLQGRCIGILVPMSRLSKRKRSRRRPRLPIRRSCKSRRSAGSMWSAS